MVAVYRCNARFRAGINQSDAEIAIDNAFYFFVSGSWSRCDKNMVLDVDIVVKRQIQSLWTQSAAPRESTTF